MSLYRCIDEDHEKCMQEKCISKSRLNNLTKMARAYKDLEGDDPIVEKMIDDLKALPHKTKNDEVKNV